MSIVSTDSIKILILCFIIRLVQSEVCNNPNRQVKISFVIVPVKPVLEIGCWQCYYHEKLIKLFCIEVLETKREFSQVFSNFLLFPYFNTDVQPELINNNFADEKESLISSKKCKRQQFRKRNLNLKYKIGVKYKYTSFTLVYLYLQY